MVAPAAMQGDFVDLRFIKGRKVCQVVIEIPIEAGASFVAAFGTPNPSVSVPVAIARIDPKAKKVISEPEVKTPRKWNEVTLPQQAGILCSKGAFKAFLNENYKYDCRNADDCKQAIYELCKITSRTELNSNANAADLFTTLEREYHAWFLVAA